MRVLTGFALFFIFFCCILFISATPTFADTLLIQQGRVYFVETGDTIPTSKHFYGVLGSSSGVSATVSISLFTPSNTPTPTPTRTPTPTTTSSPSSTPTSTPTNTPTPTLTPTSTHTIGSSPTPTPTPPLIAVKLTTGNENIEKKVTEVVIQDENGNKTLTITASEDGKSLIINHEGTIATTTLPVQIGSTGTTLQVKTGDQSTTILLPKEALNKLIQKGTYLIPSTLSITLEKQQNIVYVISGKEKAQILGRFIWEFSASYIVNAVSGGVSLYHESLLLRILMFLRIAVRVLQ